MKHTHCSAQSLPYSTCLQLCWSPQSWSCHSESDRAFTCGDSGRLFKKNNHHDWQTCTLWLHQRLDSYFDSCLYFWLCVCVLIVKMCSFCVCDCKGCVIVCNATIFPPSFCFSLLGLLSSTTEMPRKIIHKSSGRRDRFSHISWSEIVFKDEEGSSEEGTWCGDQNKFQPPVISKTF